MIGGGRRRESADAVQDRGQRAARMGRDVDDGEDRCVEVGGKTADELRQRLDGARRASDDDDVTMIRGDGIRLLGRTALLWKFPGRRGVKRTG